MRLCPSVQAHLYNDPSAKTLDLEEIAGYIKEKIEHIEVDIREEFISHCKKEEIDNIAAELARIKVRDLYMRRFSKPLYGEVEYEKKILKNLERRYDGIIYDGFELLFILQKVIPPEEADTKNIHIIFTNRLFATFDDADRRYHARVIVCGYPSIISTTGIVEAPAKPKEFYELKKQYIMLGIPLNGLKEKFRGKFIDYDDPRLTEVMKGYVMQAIFYHIRGEPFCEEKNCRLYNAHWQEEVLKAQLNGKFCKRHEKMLKALTLK